MRKTSNNRGFHWGAHREKAEGAPLKDCASNNFRVCILHTTLYRIAKFFIFRVFSSSVEASSSWQSRAKIIRCLRMPSNEVYSRVCDSNEPFMILDQKE